MYSMRKALKVILAIQEFDVKMIRLMRLKKQRQDELIQIESLRKELVEQLNSKKGEIQELNDECLLYEQKIEEHKEKIKKLEGQQSSIKKLEEFNALTKEITMSEREKAAFEMTLSNLVDKKNFEEEIYGRTKQSLNESDDHNKKLQDEIKETVSQINEEGMALKKQRDIQAKDADSDILVIYERLLRNKKDRVIVPLENRICSGCHIALTAQHENVVRKGEKLVFCEHCSRIHFWAESHEDEDEEKTVTKRRRRRAAVSS